MHNVQLTPIIGLPQFNGWSQVTTGAEGKLVCAYSIAGLNAGNVGRDVVTFFAQANPQTADQLHTLLLSLLKEIREKGCQLELALGAVLEDTALFATYSGLILLKRNEKVGSLIKSEQQLKIIQGSIKTDDVFVLMTGHASAFRGEVQQKLIQGYDVDTIVTSVVPSLHSLEDSSLSSFGFVVLSDQHSSFTAEVVRPTLGLDRTPKITTEDLFTPQEIAGELETEPPAETELVSQLSQPVVVPPKTQEPAVPGSLAVKAREFLARIKSGFSFTTTTFKQLAAARAQAKLNPATPTFSDSQKTKKKVLSLVLLVILIATVAGLLFWWQRQQQAQVFAAEMAVAPWVEQIESAKSRVEAEPVVARSSMEQAIQELEALAITYKDQPTALRVVQEHLTQARGVYDEFSGREEMQSLSIFYDFRLVESDFVVSKASLAKETSAFLDGGKKQIITLDLASKQVKKLPLLQTEKVNDLVFGAEKLLILGNGIHSLALTSEADANQAVVTLIEEGDSNRDGSLIGYFNQYIYIFNPVKRNIYRYAPDSDQKYSDPIGWIKPGNPVSYENVNSWSIDGDIWLGTKDGQIYKLTSGAVADFTVSGLPQPLTESLVVFTQEDLQYLYVLEPSSQRVIILSKTGEFIRQVTSPSLASATTLVVSESLSKVLVMSGSLIFDIPLE